MTTIPERELDPADLLGSLTAAADAGEVVVVHGRDGPQFLLREPVHVAHVLVSAREAFDKYTRPYLRTRALFGHGLLTSDGVGWQRRRRLVQPALERRAIAEYLPVVLDAADELVARLEAARAERSVVDVGTELSRATATVLTRSVLGRARPQLARDWAELVGRHLDHDVEASQDATRAMRTRATELGAELDDALDDAVDRLAEGHSPLLAALMAARDGDRLTRAELREEVATLLFAGAETTSAALSWTLLLLARHPAVADGLVADLTEQLGRGPTSAQALMGLRATRRVLDEALRLFPPAWSISRRATAEQRLGDVTIPAGAEVMLSPWVTHRLASVWERPQAFEPERFEPGAVASRPRFAHFPFLGGPRRCVGAAFANLEALAILARVLPRFRFAPFVLSPGWPEPWVTLRPRGGLWLDVEARG